MVLCGNCLVDCQVQIGVIGFCLGCCILYEFVENVFQFSFWNVDILVDEMNGQCWLGMVIFDVVVDGEFGCVEFKVDCVVVW